MKRIVYSAIITAILCMVGITVCASTADSVQDATESNTLMSQFGADYLPPFVKSGNEIELNDCSVNFKELDLSLPGKNGFDLNLYRAYNSSQNLNGYELYDTYVNGGQRSTPVYRFTCSLGEYYIKFDNEESIVDSFTSSSDRLGKNNHFDMYDTRYISYSHALDTSGRITLTRDKTADKKWLYEKHLDKYDPYINNLDVAIGENWSVRMPQLQYMTYTTNSNDTFRRYKYIFRAETGEMIDLRQCKQKVDGVWEASEDVSETEHDTGYTSRMYDDNQTNELGFEYNAAISDLDGKTYYFLNNNTDTLPVAVTDRYNNAIYYTRNADGSVNIVDTMGRTVNVSAGGISVEAGDVNQSVTYSKSEIYDADRDPYGKLDCFTTKVLTVCKNQNDTSDKTEYYIKNRPIIIDSSFERYSPKVTKVVYPTNAYTEYTYESTASKDKYVVNSAKSRNTFDYREYQISQKSIYENGNLKQTLNYHPTERSTGAREVNVKDTMPGNITRYDRYNYDKYGRLEKEEVTYSPTSAGDRTKTEYGYSDKYSAMLSYELTAGQIKAIRKAYVMNTRNYVNGKLINAVDTKYRKTKQLTHRQQGESTEDYVFDENYGIPTKIETKKDSDTTISTENTLTSDNKSIAVSKIYENGVLKKTTEYSYNTDGTLKQSKEESDEYGRIITDYSYTYGSDSGSSVTETVKNVNNADNQTQNVSKTNTYDSLGRLAAVTDGNGNTTRYEYDMCGRVTKQINPDNTYKTISYNAVQNSVTVTDENGNITTNDYTPLGKPSKIYLNNNESDVIGEYTYDSLDRVLSEKVYQELGGASTTKRYSYDANNRITQKTDTSTQGDLDTETYTYAYDNSFTTYTSSNQTENIDVSEYDKALIVAVCTAGDILDDIELKVRTDGELVFKKYMCAGNACTIPVDLHGKNKLSVFGASSTYIKYLKDSDEANLAGGDNQTVTTTYTGDSTYVKPTEVKKYDGFGNVVSETYYQHGTDTLLNKNIYKYDLAGNVLETNGGRNYMENLSSYTAKTEYDYMGNPVKSYRADGEYTTAVYNKQGKAISTTDYMGNTETVNYDRLGRAIKSETPFDNSNNAKTLTYYDNNGNIIKTKEQNNAVGQAEHYAVKEYEYDSRNRLTCVKVNDGERDIYTQYAYDNVGNMVKMVTGQTSKISNLFGTLPNEATWQTYEYDRFGNVTKATDALGQSETASYNLMKLPTSKTDKNGINTALTYNAYGSLTKSTVGTDIITNTYNVNNLMLSSTRTGGEYNDGSGDVSYTYDVYGNIKTETTNGVTNTYTYDVNGNRKSFVQKEGTTTYINAAYNYDNLNQLTNVSFDNGIGASYTYDKNGRLKTENRGIVNSTYAYNKAGLVTNLNNTKGKSYEYTYRLDGRQICNQSINENGSADATNNYRYNNIGQLEDEWCNETGIDYKYIYDTRGNRIRKYNYNDSITDNYTYDKNNRLISKYTESDENEDVIDTAYVYDHNGNLKKETKTYYNNEELSSIDWEDYSYDNRNRMIKYETSNIDYECNCDDYTCFDYEYDAMGRLKKKNNRQNILWDGDNITAEKTVYSSFTRTNVYYRGINMIAQNISGTPSYYIYNAHGDTMSLVDTSGNIKKKCNNDAFGKNFLNSGTGDSTPFRYNGQYTDRDSGLIYLRNRYYDPSIGRFTQEDPAKDGLNWYVYCANDPVNFVDPWGLTLTLIGNADEVWERYQSILLLTDDSLVLQQIGDSDSNVYGVHILEHGYGDRPIGTDLVRRIINDEKYDCKIQTAYGNTATRAESANRDGAYMWYDKNNTPHSSYGSEATIYIGELAVVPVDGGGGDIPERMSLQIAIGHEMIHALRMMNGNFKDEGYYIDQSSNIPYEEYEVTGISYYDSNGNFVNCANWVTTENALRREQRGIGQPGHALRVGYYVW